MSASGPSLDVARSLRALVLDDNPFDRRLLVTVLEESGWDVQTAASPSDAASLLEMASALGRAPDVIVLDLVLPDMDGLTFAEQLRRDDGLAHSRIVAVSAWASEEAQREALRAGCDHFIPKPIDVRLFAGQLERVTRRDEDSGSHDND